MKVPRFKDPLRALVIILAVLASVTACGRGEDPVLAPPSPEPDAEATPAPEPLEDASCDRRTGGDRDAAMFLSDVRVATYGSYDRVVFEFEPHAGQSASVPYFEIAETEPPLTEDPTGSEVEVEGSAFLELRIWASGVDLSGDEPRAVYTGPRSRRPSETSVLREIREAGDFENTMTWYLGLGQPACFVMTTLDGPSRLVVDVDAQGREP